jgi:hypothetical protein
MESLRNIWAKTTSFTDNTTNPYIVPLVIVIVVIFIVAIGIFIGLQYNNTKNPTKVLLGPIALYNPAYPVLVERDVAIKTMKNTYTLSMYMKFDIIPDMRANIEILKWPNVWTLKYNPSDEAIVIEYTISGALTPTELIVKNIPLQRWNQIVITFEGRTVDIYCNGTLRASPELSNLPPVPNDSINISQKQVVGEVAYIQIWPRRLTVSEVASNYTNTSDSQGRPYLGPEILKPIKLNNLFCPSGQCIAKDIIADISGLKWEFPYN